MNISDVKEHYIQHEEEIQQRLKEFQDLKNSSDKRWFKELVFVILTSQSSAKKAWEATEKLDELNYILDGDKEEIAEILGKHEIQYEDNKAAYIVENREFLSQPTLTQPSRELRLKEKLNLENLSKSRSWIVENIKGLSWKGASHFLRNIGYGDQFGIISQHILTRLRSLKLIESAETPSNEKEYKKIEDEMQKLADQINVDIQALDLVLWSMETGEVFK